MSELKIVAGFTAPNTSEHIFYLEPKGAEIVAAQLGVSVNELPWQRTNRAPKDYYFLEHFLKVNDFRIELSLQSASAAIRLLGFIPEYYGSNSDNSRPSKHIKDFVCDISDPTLKISHTPDAVFALEKNQIPALFFLEIDRGTETIADEQRGVMKHVRFYLNYLMSSGYQRYREDFGCDSFKGFRALFVTTSEIRKTNLRKAITGLPFAEKAKRFIWLTHEEELRHSGALNAIWRSADLHDDAVYGIS